MTDISGTRDKFLQAAITVLESDGEVGLRIDRVLEVAGFTKPVLYHHFADRDTLIVAAQVERYRRSLDVGMVNLMVSVDGAQTSEKFIDQLVQAIGDFTSLEGRRRRRLRIEVLGSAVQRPALQSAITEANRDFVASLGDFLMRARKAGLIAPKRDPRDLAAWWLSVVVGRHVIDVDADRFNEDEWTAIVLSTVRSLLVGDL